MYSETLCGISLGQNEPKVVGELGSCCIFRLFRTFEYSRGDSFTRTPIPLAKKMSTRFFPLRHAFAIPHADSKISTLKIELEN